MLYIQELSSFGYTPLSVSFRLSPLSPCMCVKILSILKNKLKKKKNCNDYYNINSSNNELPFN